MSGINRDWPLIRSLTTEPEHEKSNLHQAQASNLRLCCVTKCKEIYERQKMPKVANKSSDVLNCFIEINILFETRNDISHVAHVVVSLNLPKRIWKIKLTAMVSHPYHLISELANDWPWTLMKTSRWLDVASLGVMLPTHSELVISGSGKSMSVDIIQ